MKSFSSPCGLSCVKGKLFRKHHKLLGVKYKDTKGWMGTHIKDKGYYVGFDT